MKVKIHVPCNDFILRVAKSKYGGLFSILFLSFPFFLDMSLMWRIALLCGW